MAIERMVMVNLVGAQEEEHVILEQLVLSKKVHLNLEQRDMYDNTYMVHQYETLLNHSHVIAHQNSEGLESKYHVLEQQVIEITNGLGITPFICEDSIGQYPIENAIADLEDMEETIYPAIKRMNEKRNTIKKLTDFKEKLLHITDKKLPIGDLTELHFFEYEIGFLSKENKIHIKRNYENISAIVSKIGDIADCNEDMYLVIYPTQFKEETKRILKSLSWSKLDIPIQLEGNVEDILGVIDTYTSNYYKEITTIENTILKNKEEMILLLNRIYTRLKLEEKILSLEQEIVQGSSVFMLNAWIREKDKNIVEEAIGDVTDKYVILTKTPSEVGEYVLPPTQLKNNWFFRPFEMIVKLYGLPSYHEIDPTPFLAITFCLMFGIMFGDIGQGLVYFIAGIFLLKKIPIAGGVLTRLGMSSIVFGFVYGSFFGLEKIPLLEEIALVHGGPLHPSNIPVILGVGVAFGVIVLTVSFVFGIINALRRKDIENGVLGKNGIVGYLFFMGLIFTGLTIVKVVPVSVIVPIIVMVSALIIMVFKEPLANLLEGKRPLIHGEVSSYYVESGFECIETLLAALSNAISFIRVGAFALNHAGLFLAFLVMAEMMPNIVLQLIVLILGNLLILSLEGLVVFIQGLRLQYYEMFSKYFTGDGVAYNPTSIK